MTGVLASRLSALRRRRSDELVPDAVVVGSGVGGLLAALAMGRAGHRVVLLERDHMAEAKDPEAAFAVERSGAPHIHQTHGFLSRLLLLLRERFQDVLTDLQAVGGFTLSMTKILGDERPGDEDLRVLVVRRSTFEWLLRRKVDSEPNITVRTGTGVVGLTTSGVDEAGRPIVSGVDLEDGGSVRAGVVIAATGHRGDIPGWLSGIGVACPESEHSSDLIYLTQWYRQSSPTNHDDPRLFGGLPYLRYLAVPGDGNTLSITLAVPSSDRELRRALLEPGSFERACRALPGPDRFFAPSSPSLEPLGGVRPMAGLLNRIRRFTDDAGRPTTLGFHVIGDAHTTTNPILGRGCTLTALQAVMIADAYGEHPGRPLQRAMSYEAACRAEVEPWFENALQVEALERGLPSDGSPARFAAETIGALFASGQGDPLLGRALAQYVNLLRTPTQIATDPAIVEALTERTGAAASPSTGVEGPTREELLLHLDRSATTVAPPSPPPVTTRQVAVEGASLRVIASGPADGPAVVLVHGFPELARSWQHQVTALASAGYRVLAADQRGCGGSTGPAEIEGYDIHHLIGDLLGLLDAEELERAAFVGHDWGAMVVSTLALLHPDRVTGVVTLSVPLLARGPASPLQLLSAAAGEGFFYMSYFQEPGVADAELDRDPADTFLRMFADPTDPPSEEVAEGSGLLARLPRSDRPPAWLGQEGLAVYVEEYTRTGFTPALNLYRNLDRNWETTADLDGAQVTVPTAFITGSRDQVNLMLPAQVMDGHVTDHRFTAYVEGAGHWVQQERPDEVNGLLLRFLRSLGSNGNETGREDR